MFKSGWSEAWVVFARPSPHHLPLLPPQPSAWEEACMKWFNLQLLNEIELDWLLSCSNTWQLLGPVYILAKLGGVEGGVKFYFFKNFFYPHLRTCLLILERGEGREKEERNIGVTEKHMPQLGTELQPKPLIRIEPVTFWSVEWWPTNWATLAWAGGSKVLKWWEKVYSRLSPVVEDIK